MSSPKFKAVSLTEFQDVLLSGETWKSFLTATVSSPTKVVDEPKIMAHGK
jgi:hypothetical protein